MNAKRNSYRFSRVAVRLSMGSTPSVTIARSTFCVNELCYRTSSTTYETISRHISRVDDLETFQVDLPVLDRIRSAIAQLSAVMRRDADEYIEQEKAGSSWFFHPRENGWLAMFDGQPTDVNAFRRWICDIVA